MYIIYTQPPGAATSEINFTLSSPAFTTAPCVFGAGDDELGGALCLLAALGALEPPLEALLARLGGSLGLLHAPGGRPRPAPCRS